ncbi:MAG TPA: 6-phosphogluconolactonase [Atribacterota bacterium]|nr:6-phosphogluconolactonase [Atribacterota bacterium]
MNCNHCKIFSTSDKANQFIVTQWSAIASRAIQNKGNFTVALSGGKTPMKLFKLLRNSIRNDLWNNTHIFMVDERFVPVDHPESNQLMIRENLIVHNFIGDEHFYPIPINEDSKSSANAYQCTLKKFFRFEPGMLPMFDLILLGIGRDGHTASIFPGDSGIMQSRKLVRAVDLTGFKHERITLALTVLNQAKNIFFLVLRKGKAEIIKNVLERKNRELPATHIDPPNGKLWFVLDREAASLLNFSKE